MSRGKSNCVPERTAEASAGGGETSRPADDSVRRRVFRYLTARMATTPTWFSVGLLVTVAVVLAELGSIGSRLLLTGRYSITSMIVAAVTSALVSLPLSYLFVATVKGLNRSRENLRELRDQARDESRAKSYTLANISHELQTPLNAILGFSAMLSDQTHGPLGDPKYLEYAADIQDSGKLLLDIVRELLNLSKLEAGAIELNEEAVDVSVAVAAAVRMVGQSAKKKRITVTAEPPDEQCRLYADQRLLLQMLLNLLSNAVKFSRRGSSVGVRARLNRDGGLAIAVSDTGIGIAPVDIPKVLEPFGQADDVRRNRQPGSGLGLALVRSMMHVHGGYFRLRSKLGEGTTATLHFPSWRVRIESASKGRSRPPTLRVA